MSARLDDNNARLCRSRLVVGPEHRCLRSQALALFESAIEEDAVLDGR